MHYYSYEILYNFLTSVHKLDYISMIFDFNLRKLTWTFNVIVQAKMFMIGITIFFF